MSPVDVFSAVLALTGCALTLLAAVGAARFPDVLSRMHATTKAATLGILLLVLAALPQAADAQSRSLLVLVGVFQLLTAPVASHMIGRAAYRVEASCRDALTVDELRDALESDAASEDLRIGPAPEPDSSGPSSAEPSSAEPSDAEPPRAESDSSEVGQAADGPPGPGRG